MPDDVAPSVEPTSSTAVPIHRWPGNRPVPITSQKKRKRVRRRWCSRRYLKKNTACSGALASYIVRKLAIMASSETGLASRTSAVGQCSVRASDNIRDAG